MSNIVPVKIRLKNGKIELKRVLFDMVMYNGKWRIKKEEIMNSDYLNMTDKEYEKHYNMYSLPKISKDFDNFEMLQGWSYDHGRGKLTAKNEEIKKKALGSLVEYVTYVFFHLRGVGYLADGTKRNLLLECERLAWMRSRKGCLGIHPKHMVMLFQKFGSIQNEAKSI